MPSFDSSTRSSSTESLKEQVRAKYEAVARGGESCCGDEGAAFDMSEEYDADVDVTAEADLDLGCGLPTEHAGLSPGDRVLDLGSGAGMDAFVARREVGEEGHVHGVDVAGAMVEKARANAETLGYDNVTFEVGDIEDLPIEDDAFDVVLSNCVLNLVPDKHRAFREARRVLRPGGHFCISDVVREGSLPDALREDAERHVGCVAGAMDRDEYLTLIRRIGFEDVRVPTEKRIDLPDALLEKHLDAEGRRRFRDGAAGVWSITVVGTAPEGGGASVDGRARQGGA